MPGWIARRGASFYPQAWTDQGQHLTPPPHNMPVWKDGQGGKHYTLCARCNALLNVTDAPYCAGCRVWAQAQRRMRRQSRKRVARRQYLQGLAGSAVAPRHVGQGLPIGIKAHPSQAHRRRPYALRFGFSHSPGPGSACKHHPRLSGFLRRLPPRGLLPPSSVPTSSLAPGGAP